MLRVSYFLIVFCITFFSALSSFADQQLLKVHCVRCHSGKEPKGDLDLLSLKNLPQENDVSIWETSLDYVKSKEMPPAKKSQISDADREKLVLYFL